MFSGAKNSGGASVPAMTLTKSSIAAWLSLHRAEERLHLGLGRLERREVGGEPVHRQRLLVAGSLPRAHRVLGAECRRERLRVAERVGDPERRDRVLVVPGVADERPARAERRPELAGHVPGAGEARLPRGRTDPLRELGHELEGPHVGPLDVPAVGVELRLRPALHDAGEVVVGRQRRPPAAVLAADVRLEAVAWAGRSSRRSTARPTAGPRRTRWRCTARATRELRPSAPTTSRARSVTVPAGGRRSPARPRRGPRRPRSPRAPRRRPPRPPRRGARRARCAAGRRRS